MLTRESRRNNLPYGTWTLEDGSEVLFNRRYAPMHRRSPEGQISSWPKPFKNDHDPKSSTWVRWTGQTWLYNDGVSEYGKQKAGTEALQRWGLAR